LTNGHSQADTHNAQASIGVEGADIEAHRLARAHGNHENGRGHERRHPNTWMIHAGKEFHVLFKN
jgi:hypothetical protein